ncbi:hypothetical protein AK830_g4523 [Neonectria ditissima]|uniref:Flo11 n=1 Tax=Neonectria ditissima TaxID=78410 RepID=A0A0P7AVS3_9HYPO|nr:hypothetical protein AK830_g4523 [Neonectria ditissima]
MTTPIPELTMSQPLSGAALPPRGIRSRTQSMSSDRPSTIALSLMSPPLSVSPEAAFIAASAASQIVTNDHDSHAETWYDQHGIEPAGETALVSQEALLLVNNFLDQLLFNFLSISRATTLSALRPAVAEVLKPKLAKDAVNNADEELREYLGEGDEDDFVQPQGGDPSRDWDLELVWKRTRLRCMVYSSLGDMEEEDEDLHMEHENLEIGADEQTSALISPAVAIFLTSVLEYMGELTLTVAGQAAYHRLRTKFQKEIKDGSKSPTDISERIVVEDQDMERVALDRTLGRLWRGWKKRIRSPTFDLSGRPFSRSSMGHLRRDSSLTELNRTPMYSDGEKEAKKGEKEAVIKDVGPSEIALPMGNNDVDEIEVPGLASYSDDEDEGEEEEDTTTGNRPKSLLILPFGTTNGLPTPILSQPVTPDFAGRKRSNSLPTPGTSPYRPAIKRSKDSATAETSAVTETQDSAVNETKPVEQSTPVEEPTAKSSAAKRLSKIVTDPSAAAAFRSRSRRGTGEEGDGKMGYEKAEILTSARVSVSGSASPALSDSAGPFSMKRSNSVHSPRIIDVTGPKSPSGSRSPSADNSDRVRPVSVALSAHSSNQSYKSSPEEPPMPKSWGTLPRPVVTGSKSRSPVDRMRGSISNAATISESDEETERDFPRDQNTGKNATFQSSPLTHSIPESPPAQRKRPQPLVGLPAQPRPSPHRKTSSGTKVTILRAPSAPSPLPEDRPAEISRKTSSNGWQGSRDKTPTSPTHSIGMVSIERSKTKDDEEEAGASSSAPRPIHTSGSSASSGTSRLKAVRTSEENASRSENVARNFEELIQSNQTITYTLTPENMRDMDHKRSLDQPLASKGSWKNDDARNHNRSRSSSAATEVKSYHRATGPDDKSKGGLHSPLTSSVKSARSLTGAREARVPSDSTADFADFIKSTGPAGGQNRPSPLRSNPPGASSPAHSNASPVLDGRRVSSTSNRNRYMPREAVAEGRTGNSDLIDFIRQGPPGPSNNRIPRTVAPFRDTLDSDEMSGAVGGKAVDANIPDIRYSQASTHATDTSMPSIHSSVNSHTALLKNKGGPAPASKMFDDEEMMPKRKTRRVKDPYAIDFSDEDDDDDFITTPKPPVKKEESLAEFLKNYDPPPEPVTQPIMHKMPKKKASAPSLMGRFTRSSSNSNSSSTPQSPLMGSARSLNSRNGAKGHIPINVNVPSGYDKYGQIEKPAGRPSVPAMGGSMGRVPMKRFEPREAVSDVSRTSDLAAFLRNSEPPPEPVAPPPRQEEPSTLSKMFSRRKKPSMA